MNNIDDLDFLKIGKFVERDNELFPVNNYAEHILNIFSLNLPEEPVRFLKRSVENRNRSFMVSGMKYSVDRCGEFFYVKDITEYFDDIDHVVDLMSLQHEIKNPLTVIDGAAQILQIKIKDSFVYNTADKILKESKRIKNILDEISLLHRDLSYGYINIRDIIKELVESIRISYPDSDVIVEIDPEISEFFGDRKLLYIALFNILKNSCEAKRDTSIRISLSLDSSVKVRKKVGSKTFKMLKIAISDISGGITNEHLEKIFTPFFTTKSKGSGLGLFISKSIIEKHDGRIYVNTMYGYGTNFIILIPYRIGGEND
ncbi:MAG: two-component system sensor histidine kinase NtrB [Calditerrivibrio sp.]|uniref:two-component system sensor histidine kinase NtrB n=1 Tax=Calditerrivibrio sp. TaxID=2792612 RepID=UPI003D0D143C